MTARKLYTEFPLIGGGSLDSDLFIKVNLFNAGNPGIVPPSGGHITDFLRADGKWAAPPGGGGAGSVTSIATTAPITGGTITTTGTIGLNYSTGLTVTGGNLVLANTAVTPASYTLSNITVDQQGRLTAASSYAGTTAPSDKAITALSASGVGTFAYFYDSPGTGLATGATGNIVKLADTAVTPGSYTNTNLTVDQQGRITAASNGTGGSGSGLFSAIMSATPTQSSTGLTTWGHQPTSATVTNDAQGVTVFCPGQSSSVNVASIERSAPATPYTITVLLGCTHKPGVDSGLQFSWANNGSGGKALGLIWEPNGLGSAGTASLRVFQDNSYTSNNSVVSNLNSYFGAVYWFRLKDDGTTASMWVSATGDSDWYQFYSVTKSGSYLGTGAGAYGTISFGTSAYAGDCYAKILSWTIS